MHLLVGIDTEGDNQWDAAARADQRFENIYALPRLHALFARHAVRPTYVITHPVACDPRSAEVLRTLMAGGDCEVGAHHHAWETPPCTAEDVARHAYASTLPRGQFDAQVSSLTEAITANIGVHHVHHLAPKVPNYRLQRCLDENPGLKAAETMSLAGALGTVRLKLYDEERGVMIGWRELALRSGHPSADRG